MALARPRLEVMQVPDEHVENADTHRRPFRSHRVVVLDPLENGIWQNRKQPISNRASGQRRFDFVVNPKTG